MKIIAEGKPVHNWEGSIRSVPSIVVQAETVEDIVAIVKDSRRFPSPVRAVGSNHSTTRCAVADQGTVLDMTPMNRILEIDPEAKTVTAQAGALYIDVAQELLKHNLQFFVNVELGNLSLGSAACGGTKDASMPGEYGQICSYAVEFKLVTHSGELMQVTEHNDPELIRVMRSSYGLFGVIYEVTFKVKELQPMAVDHITYSLRAFETQLPALIGQGQSMMLYLFPFLDKITVEYRRYGAAAGRPHRFLWWFRNTIWKNVGPGYGYLVTKLVPIKAIRYRLIDRFNQVIQFIVHWLLKDRNTIPSDQIIRYPKKSNWMRYTFSIWAFPEEEYAIDLREYFAFCRNYSREHGYRCNLLNVGYRIRQDQSSLFSYSFNGNVLTLDPVSTGDPGWQDFLVAYNEFCSERGGVPLFNQTRDITPAQAKRAFGGRLSLFREHRERFDPGRRFLNDYFRQVLGVEEGSAG